MFRPAALLLVLSSIVAPAPAAPAGEAAQEARARALLEMLGKPRPARRAFVERNFSPAIIERRGLDGLTGLTADLNEDLGDAPELVGVRAGEGLELMLRTGEGQSFTLLLRFDAEARIDGIGLRPAEAPDAGMPAGPVAESALPAAIGRLVDARVGKGFSGAVLVARDGQIVFGAAAGQADRAQHRDNTLDTPFNLGSMNKMFTALVIAQLVEEGRLGFDDPLAKHLPGWPDTVTIGHLLSHTAGYGSYWGPRHAAAAASLDSVPEYLALCEGQKPAAEPGAAFQYSNCGFVILGAVIERLTGQDYYTVVRERIYRRAGMRASDHYARDDSASKRALGYLPDGRDNSATLARRGSPAGGGYASANDLLRFATALRAGRLVQPATLAILTTPRAPMGSPDGPGSGGFMYGYGFGVISAAGERFVGHNGGAPGVNADMAMFDSGWTVIVLSNKDRGAQSLAQALQRLIGSRIRP